MSHAISRVSAGDVSTADRRDGAALLHEGARLSARGDDEPARGHDHPVAVLALDLLDAPEPGHEVAGNDFDDTEAPLDQGGVGAIGPAQGPALDDRSLGRAFGLDRAGGS